jgi:hypothetical protein
MHVGEDATEGDAEVGAKVGASWVPSMVVNTELGRGTGMGAVHAGRGWGTLLLQSRSGEC